MKTIEVVFATSIAILFYTYFGYWLIITLLAIVRKKRMLPQLTDRDLPEVTHVIAAFNEEDIIEEKVRNCQAIDYPAHKIKTLIVTDGSTDNTVNFLRKFDDIINLHKEERAGKLAAVKRVMKSIDTPITVFSDANAMINSDAVRKMMSHFQSNQVGAVSGEKKVVMNTEDDAAASGEGIYWKYESFLKKMDYQVNSVVGAAGELFAVRTHLFEAPKQETLIEDFVITMKIAEKGYKVAYEPNAIACENSSSSIAEEMKRKVRISAGGLQASWQLRNILNPFKFGFLSFQLFCHRVLRWTLAPVALVTGFVSNMLLADQSPVYHGVFALQSLFFFLGLLGYVLSARQLRIKAFFIPFYFLFMNLNVYVGLYNLLTGNYSVTWERARRK